MNTKNLLNDGIMNFFFKKEEGRCLSNFWESIIRIDDDTSIREYDSGECCFHGEKFFRISKYCNDVIRKKELLDYSKKFLRGKCQTNGNIVKKMGRLFILNKEELEIWHKESINVQTEICKYKFNNYLEVRNELIASKGKILIHPAMRCSEEKVKHRLWEGKGIVMDGKIEVLGMNMLGKLWMKLRNE